MTEWIRPGVIDRRSFLGAAGAGLAGAPTVGATARRTRATGTPEPSVTFEDQQSDGRSVVVAEVATDRPSVLAVFDVAGEARIDGPPIQVEAGETLSDVTFDLAPPLEESQRLEAVLHEENAGRIAADDAFVSVGDDEVVADGTAVTLVDAAPDDGFNYPYYLYAPPVTDEQADDPRPIMVQPVNTGEPSDDLEVHRRAAERRVTERWTRRVSDELTVPLLVPVFPRPVSEPVDDTHDVHSLDTDTMHLEEGPLERVDLQLERMIEHARATLGGDGYPVADEVVLNGFSASGTFVNRWAALHPENVLSVSAGGTNGMLILPVAEAKGHTLNYQIGIADLESLIGEPFDREAFADVQQFWYLGQLDGNDSLPQRFRDGWSDEQRRIALDVYGIDLQYDRFPYCQTVYEAVGASAHFRIYEGVGHNPLPAVEDVVEFHRRAIAGEDLSGFGQELGAPGGGDDGTAGGEGAAPEAAFEYSPSSPSAGEPVQFDAGRSTTSSEQLLAFTWDFGDGETAAGVEPTHAFAEAGEYTVTLSVVDDRGETGETSRSVTVAQGSGDVGDTVPVPGFGITGVVAGLGGAGYLLGRRDDRDEE